MRFNISVTHTGTGYYASCSTPYTTRPGDRTPSGTCQNRFGRAVAAVRGSRFHGPGGGGGGAGETA